MTMLPCSSGAIPLPVPAVVIFALAIILAFGLPPTYQSQATILIQQQAVAADFVRSSVNSFASQQVQTH